MKSVICIILLTLLVTCGIVYGNPAIDALEQEMELIYPDIGSDMEVLEKYSKLREIRNSMVRQERDNEVVREWLEYQKAENEKPCISMFRQDCKGGVRI